MRYKGLHVTACLVFLAAFMAQPCAYSLNSPARNNTGRAVLIGSSHFDFMPGSWSEGIYGWMAKNAGGGNIAVISTRTETGRLAEYFFRLGAENVEFFTIPSRHLADSPKMYKALSEAQVIFIAESNVWEQISLWRGTRTESAICDHFNAGKLVCAVGTAAELLGGIISDCRSGQVTPGEALRNASSPQLTFTGDFLPFFPGVVIKSAFFRRGGLPLLLREIAVLENDGHNDPVGVGIDEKTAVIIDGGAATVLGEGAVSIVRSTDNTHMDLDSRRPFVFTEIQADFCTHGFVYDIAAGEITALPPSAEPVLPKTFSGNFLPVTLDGSQEKSMLDGMIAIETNDHDHCSLQHGTVYETAADCFLPNSIVMPKAYEAFELYENRTGGLLWGLANHPGAWGILLDKGSKAEVNANGMLTPLAVTDQPGIMIFDSRSVSCRDYSTWKSTNSSKNPRQSVALIGVRIHLIGTRWAINLENGDLTQN